MNEKKLGKWTEIGHFDKWRKSFSSKYNLVSSVTALIQLYVLYSDFQTMTARVIGWREIPARLIIFRAKIPMPLIINNFPVSWFAFPNFHRMT